MELSVFFEQGGLAALDENTSRHLEMASGSAVVLHSLVFDDNSVSFDKQRTQTSDQ